MNIIRVATVGALLLAGSAHSQTTPSPGAAQLALANVAARPGPPLMVSSPAFGDGGDIPYENTQYRGNVFPGLSWTAGPKATRSYVIIMQDPDAIREGVPILHWTLFNVPAGTTKLNAGMTAPPPGASYGPNIRGPNQAWLGPHTPPGPKHHYHFQVFALDTVLAADSGRSYGALTGAMAGHVLAEGELVGLAQADPTAAPRAPAP